MFVSHFVQVFSGYKQQQQKKYDFKAVQFQKISNTPPTEETAISLGFLYLRPKKHKFKGGKGERVSKKKPFLMER